MSQPPTEAQADAVPITVPIVLVDGDPAECLLLADALKAAEAYAAEQAEACPPPTQDQATRRRAWWHVTTALRAAAVEALAPTGRRTCRMCGVEIRRDPWAGKWLDQAGRSRGPRYLPATKYPGHTHVPSTVTAEIEVNG